MKKYFKFVYLLSIPVFLYASSVVGQDTETVQPSKKLLDKSATESTDEPSSQEVEINEDIYRQFMELKDARQLRNMMPEEAFKSGTRLQKLDKLPEESQKHLRNQLREIIVQEDQWQPGDESKHYPYVPSKAASTDPGLEKQEAEAWGELVDGYHRREADIYKNSARSQAAMATEGASEGGSNTGRGSPGDGTGQPGAAEQTNQQNQPQQDANSGSYSANTPKDPNSAGVSQNAMEFLQGLANSSNDPEAKSMVGSSQNALEFTQGNGNQGEGQGESQGEADGSADTPLADTGQGDEGEEKSGQELTNDQNPATNNPPALATTASANEQDGQNTTGISQNALNYLTGEETQPGIDEAVSPDSTGLQGTLSIGDLRNAQGVGNTNTAGETLIKKPDEQGSGQTPPEKDGGG